MFIRPLCLSLCSRPPRLQPRLLARVPGYAQEHRIVVLQTPQLAASPSFPVSLTHTPARSSGSSLWLSTASLHPPLPSLPGSVCVRFVSGSSVLPSATWPDAVQSLWWPVNSLRPSLLLPGALSRALCPACIPCARLPLWLVVPSTPGFDRNGGSS